MPKQQRKYSRKHKPGQQVPPHPPSKEPTEASTDATDSERETLEADEILSPGETDLATAGSEEESHTDTADFDEIVEKYTSTLPARTSERGVDRYDPLRAYLQEIRQYPLLSRDEEQTIAREFYENRSEKSAHVLVLANLRLVVKIAFTYIHTGFKLLDLIQEGNIGLLQAVKQYNPYKGTKFSYYASFWIKAYIQNFILKNWSLVKLGTTQTQRRLFYNLKKEKQLLEEQGFTPTPKLLSERLKVDEGEIVEMDQRLAAHDVSLDQPASDDETGAPLMDFLATDPPRILEGIEKQELQEIFSKKLAEFRKTLSGKELVIFDKRLLSDPPATLQEIGDAYGITRERVRQIEARLIQKLKAFVKGDLPIDTKSD